MSNGVDSGRLDCNVAVGLRSSVGIRSFDWQGVVCGGTDCISFHEAYGRV